jgi:hypothetical protein
MLETQNIALPNAEFIPQIIQLLQEGHSVTLSLRGFSMRPFLEDRRDSALLRKADSPKVGEPVLAEVAPATFVLHRIVSIKGQQVTLLGDGNLTPEHCRLEDIHAQAIGFYRKGRTTLDPIAGRKWRTYSWVWMHLYPVRRYLLAAYRRIWIPLFGAL